MVLEFYRILLHKRARSGSAAAAGRQPVEIKFQLLPIKSFKSKKKPDHLARLFSFSEAFLLYHFRGFFDSIFPLH